MGEIWVGLSRSPPCGNRYVSNSHVARTTPLTSLEKCAIIYSLSPRRSCATLVRKPRGGRWLLLYLDTVNPMKRLAILAPLVMTLILGLAVSTGCGGSSSTPPPPPPPSITSFTANNASVTIGTNAILTGVFANGTGVITPGNLPATSGVGVTVSPTGTTNYVLTVSNASDKSVTATTSVMVVAATSSSVAVDQTPTSTAVTNQLLGMNMAVWYDLVANQAGIVGGLKAAGITQVRWPGGSDSDLYHWADNSECDGGYAVPSDTFANFVSDMAIPASLDVALTADYGSNADCNGGGEPSEAAAWVTAAVGDNITPSHVTVGNEEYGSWEYDLHSTPNDPTVYAAAVVGTDGYYQLIKAASPNTLVGVDVDADNTAGKWDNIVMANAKGSYDFVEYHYYPETPGQENDTFLVQQAAQGLTTNINTLRSELTKWGTADTPIYVGEIGGPYSNPGKQSWSITQGLYAGQALGEMMNAGVSRLTWWIGFGNCNGQNGNDTTSVYGWQGFGAYNVFSDGSEDTTCPGAGPIGTMSPTARAFQLFSQMDVNGQAVLTATVENDTTDVRAYAATNPKGTALLLFNDNETIAQPVVVTLSAENSSPDVTVTTYDKATYDLSGSPTGIPPDPVGTSTWAPPTTTNMGEQTLPLTLILTPWSMNMVIIQ